MTKTWFEHTASDRQFATGDQVLVFTPAITRKRYDKITDRWSGPFTFLGKLTPVTYTIDIPERHKKCRTVHATAMHVWYPPVAKVSYISAEAAREDLPDYHPEQPETHPEVRNILSSEQRQYILEVWKGFPSMTTSTLGRAKGMEHHIDTGATFPIQLHHYRIPKIWEEPFQKEIDLLREAVLIEPSVAPWAAPMFTIPKKKPGYV